MATGVTVMTSVRFTRIGVTVIDGAASSPGTARARRFDTGRSRSTQRWKIVNTTMIANRMNAIAAPCPQSWFEERRLVRQVGGRQSRLGRPALRAGVDLVEHLPASDQPQRQHREQRRAAAAEA